MSRVESDEIHELQLALALDALLRLATHPTSEADSMT